VNILVVDILVVDILVVVGILAQRGIPAEAVRMKLAEVDILAVGIRNSGVGNLREADRRVHILVEVDILAVASPQRIVLEAQRVKISQWSPQQVEGNHQTDSRLRVHPSQA